MGSERTPACARGLFAGQPHARLRRGGRRVAVVPRKLRNSPQLIRLRASRICRSPPLRLLWLEFLPKRARFSARLKILTACFQVARLLCRLADFLAPRERGAHPRIVDCGAPLRRLCAAPDRCTQTPAVTYPPRRCRGYGFFGCESVGRSAVGRTSDRDPHPHRQRACAVLQVFDLTKLGGPPGGQVANAPPGATAPSLARSDRYSALRWTGDTASKTPNIYVGATSLFGLQIVSAEGVRLCQRRTWRAVDAWPNSEVAPT